MGRAAVAVVVGGEGRGGECTSDPRGDVEICKKGTVKEERRTVTGERRREGGEQPRRREGDKEEQGGWCWCKGRGGGGRGLEGRQPARVREIGERHFVGNGCRH